MTDRVIYDVTVATTPEVPWWAGAIVVIAAFFTFWVCRKLFQHRRYVSFAYAFSVLMTIGVLGIVTASIFQYCHQRSLLSKLKDRIATGDYSAVEGRIVLIPIQTKPDARQPDGLFRVGDSSFAFGSWSANPNLSYDTLQRAVAGGHRVRLCFAADLVLRIVEVKDAGDKRGQAN